MAKSQHEITVEIAGKIASSFGSAMGTVNKQMATLGKFAGGAAKLTMAGMVAATHTLGLLLTVFHLGCY